MNTALFFLTTGAALIILCVFIFPPLDKFLDARRSPNSGRHGPEWERLQRRSRKQGLILGIFILLIGIFSLLTQ